MSIYGFVPARMAASRFPGKPLFKICDRPMVEHVFSRAKLYDGWDGLFLATCDAEIETFGNKMGWPVIMTSDHHTRCLDRVAEAVTRCGREISDDDIVVCVQGDEPLLSPDMIEATIEPMVRDTKIPGTILCMKIMDKAHYANSDIVKLIFNEHKEVLYTSRAPIPYCKGEFKPEIGAWRVGGMFGFRWWYLREFLGMPEGRLEKLESCDSNRLLDSPNRQYAALASFRPYFSVDSPDDIVQVEKAMIKDDFWGSY